MNWETFDEEIMSSIGAQGTANPASGINKSSPEPALPELADSLRHNTLGYALPLPKKPEEQVVRRTPPPIPKPYSRRNDDAPSKFLFNLGEKIIEAGNGGYKVVLCPSHTGPDANFQFLEADKFNCESKYWKLWKPRQSKCTMVK